MRILMSALGAVTLVCGWGPGEVQASHDADPPAATHSVEVAPRGSSHLVGADMIVTSARAETASSQGGSAGLPIRAGLASVFLAASIGIVAVYRRLAWVPTKSSPPPTRPSPRADLRRDDIRPGDIAPDPSTPSRVPGR
jgi:hypothetical protein